MAKEEDGKVIRSGYVKKCLISNTLFTLFFGPENKDMMLEVPKTWFRGIGRPKTGSKITLIQENGATTRMLIDNKQFYPLQNPLTLNEARPKQKAEFG